MPRLQRNRNELKSDRSTTMQMGEAAAFPRKERPARLHMAGRAPPVASRLSLDRSLLPTGGAWTINALYTFEWATNPETAMAGHVGRPTPEDARICIPTLASI